MHGLGLDLPWALLSLVSVNKEHLYLYNLCCQSYLDTKCGLAGCV